jgi:hypothetical protein
MFKKKMRNTASFNWFPSILLPFSFVGLLANLTSLGGDMGNDQ